MAKIADLPPDELNQLARDLTAGRVFTDRHLHDRPDMLRSVFMMIPLGGFAEFSEDELRDVGLIYEYLDRAGPLAVNGYPMFMSLRLLNRADAGRLFEKCRAIEEATSAALGDAARA